jgi:hypothetical protein
MYSKKTEEIIMEKIIEVGDAVQLAKSAGAFADKTATVTARLGKFTPCSSESYRICLDQPLEGHDKRGDPWTVGEFAVFDFEIQR